MTTVIESFDTLVLGRKHPAIVQVIRDNIDETIMVTFHNFTTPGMKTRAEFREKQNEFALFLFQYSDSEVPDWWKDAEVVWSVG